MSTAPTQDLAFVTSRSPLPRAVWVAFGVLGLITVALAGALVMRPAATPEPPDAMLSSAGTPMIEVPPIPADPRAPTPHASSRITAPRAEPRAAAEALWSAPGGTTRAVACATCGVVESVAAVQQQGQGSGVGVVAGGVVGGLLGHQFGGGKGKTAMTVLGAVGGGLAGNEIEKRARSQTVYDVTVRMDDGSTRTFRRADAPAVGSAVTVDGNSLRLSRQDAPRDGVRTLRTTAPADRST